MSLLLISLKQIKNNNMHMPKRDNQCSRYFRRLFMVLPIVVVLHMASSLGASAQTSIKGWTSGGESAAHIDVTYQIVKCSSTGNAELHLQLFNEKTAADTAKLNVLIADAALGQSFTTPVTKSLGVMEMLTAECGSTALSNFKIAIPAAYDPAAVTVTITFIP
jgi:hypothetical protein